MRTRTSEEKVEVVRALRSDLDLDDASDDLRPVVDRVAPWDQVEQLHATMATDQHLGKMGPRDHREHAMSSGLEGTTAIVTGAGRVGEGIGNGRAAATRLAESGVSRHVIPIMTAGDGGSIIDMSSLTGPRGGHAGITYATTKGAVLSLTQAMAAYHCQQGIRVNAVAPGMVYTPMVASKDAVDDAFGAARTSLNVLGTEGRAWDVAEAVVWLAGPGSRWVSGIVLPVDASAASFSSAIQASITDAGATISGQDVETGAS